MLRRSSTEKRRRAPGYLPLDRHRGLTTAQLSTGLGRSHSANFDHRRRSETLRTAMAMTFFCPTNNTSRFPLVTPV
jgi:hypothetical protein